MSEQELFEAWYAHDVPLIRNGDGCYKYIATQTAWVTWQGSRAPLLARIAELEADANRLDWLQEKELGLYPVISIKRARLTDGSNGYNETRVFEGWSVSSVHDEIPTVRAAIDAAIAQGSKP